jgi:hypothetical protein
MSISNTGKLAGCAAAAAIGLLISPSQAQALPPAPLAPSDCAGYAFPGGRVSLHYPAINAQTEFEAAAGSTNVDHATATTKYPQSSMKGSVLGGINGSDIHLVVARYGTSRDYSPLILDGKVGADNRAHGTYTYDQGSGSWDSIEAMKCVPAPPAPAPAPAEPKPVAVEQPAPAPQDAPAPQEAAPPEEPAAPGNQPGELCIPDPFDLNFPGAC